MRTKLLLTSIAALFLATGTAHAKGTFTNAYEACLSEGGSETCDFVVGVLSGACANGYRSECRQLKQLNRLMRKRGVRAWEEPCGPQYSRPCQEHYHPNNSGRVEASRPPKWCYTSDRFRYRCGREP